MPVEEKEYARAFLCIPVSGQTRTALAQIHQAVRTHAPGLSLSNPDLSHITLAFPGAISGEAARSIAAGMDEACSGLKPFKLTLGEGGYFGSRKKPVVLWVGVTGSRELTDLQGQLADVVRHAGVALEHRPFHPHLTVARVRTSLPPGSLTSIISCINNTHFAEIMVDHVLFMNSRLNGPGPRFTIIHQSRLKGS